MSSARPAPPESGGTPDRGGNVARALVPQRRDAGGERRDCADAGMAPMAEHTGALGTSDGGKSFTSGGTGPDKSPCEGDGHMEEEEPEVAR